jgi:peptide/nickel transport system substrate-binding protein
MPLSHSLLDTSISRRSLLKGSLATGISFAVLEAARAENTPVKGGHLRLGLDGGASTDTLDPAINHTYFMMCLQRTWGDTLVDTDPVTGKPLPGLAESWDSSDDSTTWAFKIRKGVAFHNGKELTVEDAVKTLQRHSDENSKSGALGFLSAVTAIEADGDRLIVKLQEGNVDFPLILNAYQLVVQPNGGFDDPNAAIGTGAYRLTSFDPGVRALLERNPSDWRSDRGHVDSVEILAMNDLTARVAAISSGRVHYVNAVSTKTVEFLRRNPRVKIINTPGRGHFTLPMLLSSPPFDNNDLRLALKYAIDRQEILDKILGGNGMLGNDFPVNSTYPYFPENIEQRKYDPERAAFLYKKSGHDGPIVLRTADGIFSGATEMCQIFQSNAARAKISIEVRREPSDGYWSNVWKKQPFCVCFWGSRLTQDLMYSTAYLSTSVSNDTSFRRPDFDRLIKMARSERDESRRRELYHDAAVIVRDEGGTILPVYNNFLGAASSDLGGYVPDVGNDLSNGFIASRVWLVE